VWQVALDADGDLREHADVAEITGLVDASITARWPAGMRLIVRRERPHPGATLSLFEHRDGWRYQVVATNTATGQLAFLEARHRAHARVEDRIRHAKDTGLSRLPSREYAINQAWIACVTIAADLTAWLRLLALPDSLKACEPKALRYRLLHVPARLTRGARRRRLRFPPGWPWAAAVLATFTNVMALAPG
jgi:Transposase DDE domain group 1